MTAIPDSDSLAQPSAAPLAGLTTEAALYLGFFVLALWLRLSDLGAAPLNDPEARAALSVFQFLRGAAGPVANPVYFFFTAFSFLILPAGDAAARLAPALAGAGLTLLPWFFRRLVGRARALAAGGVLAVSSTVWAAAHSADGALLTLALFGLALGLLNRHRETGGAAALWAGVVLLGMAAAGGAPFITLLLLIGVITGLVARSSLWEAVDWEPARARLAQDGLGLLIAFGLSLGLTATFGLTHRAGLAALGESLAGWFTSFAATTGRSVFLIPVWLGVYEPLILVFGGIGAVRAFLREDHAGQILAALAGLGLLFGLLNSGRSACDALWVVWPLAVLAGGLLADSLQAVFALPERWPTLTLLGLLLALSVFAGLNLTRFIDQAAVNATRWPPEFSQAPNLWLALLTVVVAGLVTFLFSATWSQRAGLTGLTLSAGLFLLAATLSAGWGVTQLRAAEPTELWWPRPAARDVRRLVQTLTAVSNFSTGQDHSIEVVAQAPADGALAWALRDFSKARFVDQLDATIAAPVVIAPVSLENPTLGSAYVGQAFTLTRLWRPDNLFANEQVIWLAARRAPTENENIVLWVRQDVQQPKSPTKP